MTAEVIPLIDLQAQQVRLGAGLRARIDAVLADGKFIMGPVVAELEQTLARFVGVTHCVTCANGTDALVLALRAMHIGPGDAVLVPAYTFAATAEAVVLAGARPVFVDVDPDLFVITPELLRDALERSNQPVRAVIPVDLFGVIPDYPALAAVAGQFGVEVIADAAQSFGATREGIRAGAFGRLATTSFFPAKPLGCYGDGGAIFTNDDTLADLLRSLRVHGQGSDKYDNVRIGTNSRLDSIQAAILLEKFAAFPAELQARDAIAARYTEALSSLVQTPRLPTGVVSNWAQYSITTNKRDALMAHLKAHSIGTAIYYPRSIADQTGYKAYLQKDTRIEVSRRLAKTMLSIPMYPDLTEVQQSRVISAIQQFGKAL